MKFVESSYEILFFCMDLKLLERAGRTCYKSEDKITDTSAEEFLHMLINRGHHAMEEFGGWAVVKFICDRGVSHALVRHRLFSFAQESTRFCNYTKDKFGSEISISPMHDGLTEAQLERRQKLYTLVEETYLAEVNEGVKPQQARDLLLTCQKTEVNVAGNAREWRHFFSQRAAKPAHPLMRKLACPLLKEFRSRVSVLFDDVGVVDLH